MFSYPFSLAQFVEKTILSLLNYLDTLVKNQMLLYESLFLDTPLFHCSVCIYTNVTLP